MRALLVIAILLMGSAVVQADKVVRDRYGNLVETREKHGDDTTVRDRYGNISRTEQRHGRQTIIRDRNGNIIGTEDVD